jgi:hypothetical protein
MSSFIILAKYYYDDHIKDSKMLGKYTADWREKKFSNLLRKKEKGKESLKRET